MKWKVSLKIRSSKPLIPDPFLYRISYLVSLYRDKLPVLYIVTYLKHEWFKEFASRLKHHRRIAAVTTRTPQPGWEPHLHYTVCSGRLHAAATGDTEQPRWMKRLAGPEVQTGDKSSSQYAGNIEQALNGVTSFVAIIWPTLFRLVLIQAEPLDLYSSQSSNDFSMHYGPIHCETCRFFMRHWQQHHFTDAGPDWVMHSISQGLVRAGSELSLDAAINHKILAIQL